MRGQEESLPHSVKPKAQLHQHHSLPSLWLPAPYTAQSVMPRQSRAESGTACAQHLGFTEPPRLYPAIKKVLHKIPLLQWSIQALSLPKAPCGPELQLFSCFISQTRIYSPPVQHTSLHKPTKREQRGEGTFTTP